MKRITSIDFTRGLVMIIMALDHTRDLIHVDSIAHQPTDLATTTPILFFTRWITHLCAPIFVFLSGLSACLSMKKKNNLQASRRFLLSRGIWLVLLEITLVNFALWFDIQFRQMILEVIFAIGFSFILLSFLLKYSPKNLAMAGLVIIFTCNVFPLLPLADGSLLKTILSPLFTLNVYPVSPNFVLILAYPVIPWFGIMLTGFASGKLFELSMNKRKSVFIKIALASITLFIILRYINVYGDPSKWSAQKDAMFTFLSFMNITKYPPSLLFALITLGIMFIILYFFDGVRNKFTDVVSVYGKVPLFYFLIHLYLIHIILVLVLFAQGYHLADLIFGNMRSGRPLQPSGLPLWGVYIVWISVVAALYPLCKRYGTYKLSHPEKKWLRYL